METIIDKADFIDGKVSTLDGLRVDFENGWGLIRPSNTTPVLVLRLEGETKTDLDQVIKRFKALINDVDLNIAFPAV